MPRTLDLIDLAYACGLVAIAVGLLQWQRVGIGGKLLLAAGRSILQLLVMGFGLQVIWQLNQPAVTLGGIAILAIGTSIAATNRIGDRLKNLLPIVGSSIFTGLIVAVGYAILVVIRPENWAQPQYLLAIVGICLGYLLNTTAIAGERTIAEIETHRAEIETHLCLGASPDRAIAPYRETALKSALVPTIDNLALAGLVIVPGFLTGELIGNVQPVNAAGYQIVALFAAVASNTIAAIVVNRGITRRYFNQHAQLQSPD